MLCSTPVDLDTIVKQFSPPSTDQLSQIGARSEAFNWHESSAIRSHEPRGALIFRVIFYTSDFPFQCFELLVSALRKGSHKFQRQFRKCATYFAAILTLCTNLPGLWSAKVVQTSIRSITVAQTSFVIRFLLRGRVEANSYLAEIEVKNKKKKKSPLMCWIKLILVSESHDLHWSSICVCFSGHLSSYFEGTGKRLYSL